LLRWLLFFASGGSVGDRANVWAWLVFVLIMVLLTVVAMVSVISVVVSVTVPILLIW
jgi:hypothetical protein